jgi:hypothetical protein
MREIRSSGSVEGVVSNHDPYSDWSPEYFRARLTCGAHPSDHDPYSDSVAMPQ